MKTVKITYKQQNLQLKFGIKEQIVFSKLTNKIFKGDSLEDNFYMFYSAVTVALGKQPDMNEFCEFTDDHPDEFAKFMNYLSDLFSDLPEVKEVSIP